MRRNVFLTTAAAVGLVAAALAAQPAAAAGETGNEFGHIRIVASVDDGSSPEGFEYEATSADCALDAQRVAVSDADGLARFTDLPYYADDGSVCTYDVAALPRDGYEVDADGAELTALVPGTASSGPLDPWGAARVSWAAEMEGTGLTAEGELRDDGQLDDSGGPEAVALVVHDDAAADQEHRSGSLTIAVSLTDRILSEQLGRTDVVEIAVDESADDVADPAECEFPEAGELNAAGACADRISLVGGADVWGELSARTVRIQTALGALDAAGACADPAPSVYVAEAASTTLCAEVDLSGAGAPAPPEVLVANAVDEPDPTEPPEPTTDPSDPPQESDGDGATTDGSDDDGAADDGGPDELAATGSEVPVVPLAAAGGAILVGGLLLLARRRQR